MTLLSAMLEAEKSIRQCFARQLIKVIFVLSPGYALLPEPLQFVFAMVLLMAERQYDVMIPAANRQVDPILYYPFQSGLPVIWSDISSAIQGCKHQNMTRVVLDEELWFELCNFGLHLKMRPGVSDEHWLLRSLANNLWVWQTDFVRDEGGNLV